MPAEDVVMDKVLVDTTKRILAWAQPFGKLIVSGFIDMKLAPGGRLAIRRTLVRFAYLRTNR